jgi:hypothetical protein
LAQRKFGCPNKNKKIKKELNTVLITVNKLLGTCGYNKK